MSTISSKAARHSKAAYGPLAMARAAVKRWWDAFIAWRVQEAAIAQLTSMSDRDLKDIGLPRSQIEAAVRGNCQRRSDREPARHWNREPLTAQRVKPEGPLEGAFGLCASFG